MRRPRRRPPTTTPAASAPGGADEVVDAGRSPRAGRRAGPTALTVGRTSPAPWPSGPDSRTVAVLAPSTAWGRRSTGRRRGPAGGADSPATRSGSTSTTAALVAWKPAFGGRSSPRSTATSPVQMATVRARGAAPPRPRAGRRALTTAVAVTRPGRRADPGPRPRRRLDAGRARRRRRRRAPASRRRVRRPRAAARACSAPSSAPPARSPTTGWLPHARQIGITGRSRSPADLFVAIGAQRQVQPHGRRPRRRERPRDQPGSGDVSVFAAADIGIVADSRKAVPALVARAALTVASGTPRRQACVAHGGNSTVARSWRTRRPSRTLRIAYAVVVTAWPRWRADLSPTGPAAARAARRRGARHRAAIEERPGSRSPVHRRGDLRGARPPEHPGPSRSPAATKPRRQDLRTRRPSPCSSPGPYPDRVQQAGWGAHTGQIRAPGWLSRGGGGAHRPLLLPGPRRRIQGALPGALKTGGREKDFEPRGGFTPPNRLTRRSPSASRSSPQSVLPTFDFCSVAPVQGPRTRPSLRRSRVDIGSGRSLRPTPVDGRIDRSSDTDLRGSAARSTRGQEDLWLYWADSRWRTSVPPRWTTRNNADAEGSPSSHERSCDFARTASSPSFSTSSTS